MGIAKAPREPDLQGVLRPGQPDHPEIEEAPFHQCPRRRRARAVELHQHAGDGTREVNLVGGDVAMIGLDPAAGFFPVSVGLVLVRPFRRDRLVLIVVHHHDDGDDAVLGKKPRVDQAVGGALPHQPEHRSLGAGLLHVHHAQQHADGLVIQRSGEHRLPPSECSSGGGTSRR